MKKFFFNLGFKVMRFFAEDRTEIDSAVTYYKNKLACKTRQRQLDLSVRPRTETYEWLTENTREKFISLAKESEPAILME